MPNVIHLHGGDLGERVNLGDNLMLHEVMRRVRALIGDEAQMSIRCHAGTFQDRAAWRLLQFAEPFARTRIRGYLGYAMLKHYGAPFGIVTNRDIAAKLNFMGYRYFDVGAPETRQDLRMVAALLRLGCPTIVLPQAYGPFSNPGLRKAAKKFFQSTRLLYARDPHSADEVAKLGLPRPAVVPDITIASEVGRNPRPDLAGAVAVVPNLWMIERTSPEVARSYVPTLCRAIEQVRQAGLQCFVLCHAKMQDQALAESIATQCNPMIECVFEPDALRAKALVGDCRFVIASRYHGLVAALSQGVPAIATSWAHKYGGLVADFDCPELLISPSEPDALATQVENLLQAEFHREISTRLMRAKPRLIAQIEAMWAEVGPVLATALEPAASN
jgi:hypothetical protein